MMVLVPSPHTLDGPVKLKLKLGTATVSCPSLKGRTVAIRNETVEISLGRMFRVQEWIRALGYPHCLQVFKGRRIFGGRQ